MTNIVQGRKSRKHNKDSFYILLIVLKLIPSNNAESKKCRKLETSKTNNVERKNIESKNVENMNTEK